MLWSGANPRGHRWSTRARSPPARLLRCGCGHYSTASLFLNIPFNTAVALSSPGLSLLRSEPSAVVVALSIVYECALLRQRRSNGHVLRQLGQQDKKKRGIVARSIDTGQMAEVCLTSKRTSQTLPGQWPQVHIARVCPASTCTAQAAGRIWTICR